MEMSQKLIIKNYIIILIQQVDKVVVVFREQLPLKRIMENPIIYGIHTKGKEDIFGNTGVRFTKEIMEFINESIKNLS